MTFWDWFFLAPFGFITIFCGIKLVIAFVEWCQMQIYYRDWKELSRGVLLLWVVIGILYAVIRGARIE